MSTKALIEYWQSIFSSANPIDALGLDSYGKELTRFEIEVAPEPYYGLECYDKNAVEKPPQVK